MNTNALHGRNRSAQGVEAKAGWVTGEPSQRGDGRFRQQPAGNGCPGGPLFVARLARTAGPDEIVENQATSPVAFTFELIVVGGKFSVVKDDATGVLYRLTGAVRIDAQLAPH